MNVIICLVQDLIQYNQPSEQGWTNMNYKKKVKKALENYDWITARFFV